MTSEGQVQLAIRKDFTWLEKHESLILVLAFLGVLVFGINRYFNYKDSLNNHQVVAAQTVVKTDESQTAAAFQAVQNLTAEYEELSAEVAQQNSKLSNQIAIRNAKLVQQQKSDQKMTDPALVTRWKDLAQIADADVTVTPTGATVTQTGVFNTVVQLEQVQTLTQNLVDTQTEEANTKKELESSSQIVGQQTTEIADLKTELTDQDKTYKAQITQLNAKARKSKLKWFGAGFVVGFIAGVVK